MPRASSRALVYSPVIDSREVDPRETLYPERYMRDKGEDESLAGNGWGDHSSRLAWGRAGPRAVSSVPHVIRREGVASLKNNPQFMHTGKGRGRGRPPPHTDYVGLAVG